MKEKPVACDSSACIEVERLDDGRVLITSSGPDSVGMMLASREEFETFITSAKLGQYDRD